MQDELKKEILNQTSKQINEHSKGINSTPDDFNVVFPDYSGNDVHRKINTNETI